MRRRLRLPRRARLIAKSYENKRDISFQGAICSHEYDGDVTAIVERVSRDGGMVLDCGAGRRQRMRPNVITTEILRYPSTDVVAVGERLPFRDGAFDAVLSLHVLEHVKNPFVCAKELARVLKPGGTLYAVTPYVVSVHGYPFHFFNPTPSGLRALFDGLIVDPKISVPRIAHPLAALKDLLGVYAVISIRRSRCVPRHQGRRPARRGLRRPVAGQARADLPRERQERAGGKLYDQRHQGVADA